MIIGWKIWFVDVPQKIREDLKDKDKEDKKGKVNAQIQTYLSDSTEWTDLPKDGCLGMILFEDTIVGNVHRRTVLTNADYYFMDENGVFGTDVDNRERKTRQDIYARYNKPYIIRGIWTDDDTYHAIHEEILATERLA